MDDGAPRESTEVGTAQLLALIDDFREAAGITHAEVARRIGISRQNLDLWRRRGMRAMPTSEVLQGVAQAIGRDYISVLTAALNDVGYLRTDHVASPPRSAEAIEMGTYAAAIIGSRREQRAFSNPVTHMKTRGETNPYFTLWRAELHMTDADNPATTVVAGYVDFIRAKIGASVAEFLTELPSDHGDACDPHGFAALFDSADRDFAPPVEQLFEPLGGVFGAAILIENVFIDPAFRGFKLGPWLVVDVIERLTEDVNDMVAMIPHICSRIFDDTFFDERTRVQESHPLYWRNLLHLDEVIVDGTLMLVQATGFTALTEAQAELASVIDGQLFPIDVAELLDRYARGMRCCGRYLVGGLRRRHPTLFSSSDGYVRWKRQWQNALPA